MLKELPQCKYLVGDIRDKSSLIPAVRGRDVVFHVAALKHVDIMEMNPLESIKTNINASSSFFRPLGIFKSCERKYARCFLGIYYLQDNP
jgi:dTDP-D-glucose 4,6-dehydratase